LFGCLYEASTRWSPYLVMRNPTVGWADDFEDLDLNQPKGESTYHDWCVFCQSPPSQLVEPESHRRTWRSTRVVLVQHVDYGGWVTLFAKCCAGWLSTIYILYMYCAVLSTWASINQELQSIRGYVISTSNPDNFVRTVFISCGLMPTALTVCCDMAA